MISDGKMDHDILVQVYFSFGISYQEIVGILASNHRVMISLRTIKQTTDIASNIQCYNKER